MRNKLSIFLVIFNSVLCGFAMIRIFFFNYPRTFRNDVIQGILIGFALAFITGQIFGYIKTTKVNGWITIYGCGLPGNNLIMRMACAQVFPGPINVPQEAMYWTTSRDGAGHTLSGKHNYIMHFPAGGLPPNNAFWSLTMSDAKDRFVPNQIDRYNVSDRSDLVQNADGSVDIYIQNTAPAGRESNWLPAPQDNFILWLRAYLPGQTILNGEYEVPPIVEAK